MDVVDKHASDIATGFHRVDQAARLPFAAAIIAVLVLCQAALCVVGSGRSLAGKVDLRAFYAAGTIVRSGEASRLYDYDYQQKVQDATIGPRAGALPFLYPPFAALLFVPLSVLSYRHAFFVLLGLNIGLLCTAAQLLRPRLPGIRQHRWLLLPAAYGSFFAVSVALMQGQISFVLLIVYCGSYVLLERGRHFRAGLLLALALMKFQVALPVILLFIVWRQWRVVAGFVMGTLGAGAISFAVVGRVGLASYARSMLGVLGATARNPGASKARYGMFPTDMPNLHGLTYALSHGAPWGYLLNGLLCCIVLGWAARQRACLLVALPAAMLVSYHMQPHDLTLLLLPLSVAGTRLFLSSSSEKSRQEQAQLRVALLCASLLLICPLAALVMARGMGYVWSLTVAVIMVAAATTCPMREPLASADDVHGVAP